jgi:mannose-6-phosphate isomerase-like protein (cupin superfamily)
VDSPLKENDMVAKEVVSAYIGSLGNHTSENDYFREVLYTGKYAQLVLMCLKHGEDIGNGAHSAADQFFYVEHGKAKFVLNGKETHLLKGGDAVLVPAGMDHNVINASRTGKLKFFTIFSPPNQSVYTIFKSKADAAKAGSEVHNTDWGAGTGYL